MAWILYTELCIQWAPIVRPLLSVANPHERYLLGGAVRRKTLNMLRQSCNHASNCIASGICQETSLPLAKPIRIIQLLLVAVVFALTLYTISRDTPYEKIEEIFLMVLYTSFLLIAIVDIISQFSGEPIPDTPMFLFGIVGTALFLMAAFGHFFVINRTRIRQIWRLTTSAALLTICSLLYLLDILLIYLYGY